MLKIMWFVFWFVGLLFATKFLHAFESKDWREAYPGNGVYERLTKPEDEVITLSSEGKTIVTIKANGEVVLAEGTTISQASEAIWRAVGKTAPCAPQ